MNTLLCLAAVAAEILWTKPICKEPGRYIGWPTVCSRSNGELLAVFSGDRDWHVCPWGKVQLVRSTDGGETWTDPVSIQDSILDDRDAGIVEMADGTLVLNWFTSVAFKTYNMNKGFKPGDRCCEAEYLRHFDKLLKAEALAALGNWVARSTDGGKTWSKPVRTTGQLPHAFTVLKDGRLLGITRMCADDGQEVLGGKLPADKRNRILCEESKDGGRSWRVIAELEPEEGLDVKDLHEPHLAELPDGRLVGQVRWHGAPTPGHWGGIVQTESTDGGRTWTKMKKTPLIGLPPHLLVLKDGRLVTVYGCRDKDRFGEYACVSEDGGRTWDTGHEICLTRHFCGDLGYPASTQLADGSIVTVYYQAEKEGETPCLMATKWKLK